MVKNNKWKDNVWHKGIASPKLNKFGWAIDRQHSRTFYWMKVNNNTYYLNPYVPCVTYLEVDEFMFNEFVIEKIDKVSPDFYQEYQQNLIDKFFWANNDSFYQVTKDIPHGINARVLRARETLAKLKANEPKVVKRKVTISSMSDAEIKKTQKEKVENFKPPKKITISTIEMGKSFINKKRVITISTK